MSRYKFESLVKAQKRLGWIAGETNKYGIDGFTRDDLKQLLESTSEDDLAPEADGLTQTMPGSRKSTEISVITNSMFKSPVEKVYKTGSTASPAINPSN
ncbi:hypothetical protein FOLKNPGA_01913 [Legionella sp. PC1000]|uniref:hypothetical protein n=1 Tax=Legionella sp. PC1000 TaxID=2746060 RepID=UPI0015FCB084|nr:hypothetical protein [Legionella sp. PC1000]QLZ69131.1 hypothetical protein FOLKNPGA_01913 [Legionella sp. PC1000]